MSTPFSNKFGHPDGLEEWERDDILDAIKKIELASDTIEKRKSQNRSSTAEEAELEVHLSKLIETVLGWAQRPRPAISKKELLKDDVRSTIRAIFILAGNGSKDSGLAASTAFSAELTTKVDQLLVKLGIDAVHPSTIVRPVSAPIWEPPEALVGGEDDPNRIGPYDAADLVDWDAVSSEEMDCSDGQASDVASENSFTWKLWPELVDTPNDDGKEEENIDGSVHGDRDVAPIDRKGKDEQGESQQGDAEDKMRGGGVGDGNADIIMDDIDDTFYGSEAGNCMKDEY